MTETIGFVRLGIMGLPMAKSLARGGPVCGHDLRERAAGLGGESQPAIVKLWESPGQSDERSGSQ